MKTMTLEQYRKWLSQQAPIYANAVRKGLRSAALRGVGVVVQEIDTAKPHPAVNTGGMRQSARAEVTSDGAAVVVDAPHAAVMNDGARPFRPPLGPLIIWAKRKFGVDEREARRIARNVQRKIEAMGIEPRFFFDKAMKRINDVVVPEEIDRALQELG